MRRNMAVKTMFLMMGALLSGCVAGGSGSIAVSEDTVRVSVSETVDTFPAAPSITEAAETSGVAETPVQTTAVSAATTEAPVVTLPPEEAGEILARACPVQGDLDKWAEVVGGALRDAPRDEVRRAQGIVRTVRDGDWGPKSAAALRAWIAAGCPANWNGESPEAEGGADVPAATTAAAASVTVTVTTEAAAAAATATTTTAPPTTTTTAPTTTAAAAASPTEALLGSLRVEPEYSGGYERNDWSVRWPSSVNNHLNWRQDNCRWAFYASPPRACDVNRNDPHREHLVAVSEANQSGGHAWTTDRKRAFFIYRPNLYVMSAGENGAKSDHDATGWRPADREVWCEFATAVVEIKAHWDLSVDAAEKTKLGEMLDEC